MSVQHFVRRAVILAAGMGKRMQPLTLNIPKPLVKVNGVRMIDTVVNALHKNDIFEIYVVVGYLKDQFFEWVKDYRGITLIDNPYYDTCNNISSLYVAREHLEDCIILDGDQIIYNPAILSRNFTISGYNAVWCENRTDEWLLDVRDGQIESCSKTGGSQGWQLYSVSRWTERDGKKLKRDLVEEFEKGNTDIFWDEVAMFLHFDDYELGIRKMEKYDIIEIDTLEELAEIDKGYIEFKKSFSDS